MEFEIKTLETGETITAELSDVGAVYADDDVVYINGSFGSVPCRLSSARYIAENPKFTMSYKTYNDLEKAGEFLGFVEYDGNEDLRKVAEKAICQNCGMDCKYIALKDNQDTVRDFAVCNHCDTAMEF